MTPVHAMKQELAAGLRTLAAILAIAMVAALGLKLTPMGEQAPVWLLMAVCAMPLLGARLLTKAFSVGRGSATFWAEMEPRLVAAGWRAVRRMGLARVFSAGGTDGARHLTVVPDLRYGTATWRLTGADGACTLMTRLDEMPGNLGQPRMDDFSTSRMPCSARRA